MDNPPAHPELTQPLTNPGGVPRCSGVDVENQSPVERVDSLVGGAVVEALAAEILEGGGLGERAGRRPEERRSLFRVRRRPVGETADVRGGCLYRAKIRVDGVCRVTPTRTRSSWRPRERR